MRLGAALVALVACASPPPATLHNAVPAVPDEHCELPWDPRAMKQKGEVHVLAWKHAVDNRPFEYDEALILIVDRGRFELANMYSHADGDPGSWRDAMITDDFTFRARDSYAAPPTRQEVDAFLHATRFEFGATDGFRITGKAICAGAWRKYLGGEPWHHFGEIGPLRSTTP